ncbi:MAG TPA: hypothetical protein VME43_19945, partial [Bryobacteraceae bacterium]|nr:hypothetical protein [Bryobacteraceae bacterium]
MLRVFTTLLLCAAAHAATIQTTLTVTNATGTLSVATESASVSGPATLSGIGSGTFSASVSVSSISGENLSAPFTIVLSGGTLAGTLLIPTTILSGATSVSATATISNSLSTGTYAGATGSFALTGSGSVSLTTGAITLSFTGPGT